MNASINKYCSRLLFFVFLLHKPFSHRLHGHSGHEIYSHLIVINVRANGNDTHYRMNCNENFAAQSTMPQREFERFVAYELRERNVWTLCAWVCSNSPNVSKRNSIFHLSINAMALLRLNAVIMVQSNDARNHVSTTKRNSTYELWNFRLSRKWGDGVLPHAVSMAYRFTNFIDCLVSRQYWYE